MPLPAAQRYPQSAVVSLRQRDLSVGFGRKRQHPRLGGNGPCKSVFTGTGQRRFLHLRYMGQKRFVHCVRIGLRGVQQHFAKGGDQRITHAQFDALALCVVAVGQHMQADDLTAFKRFQQGAFLRGIRHGRTQ